MKYFGSIFLQFVSEASILTNSASDVLGMVIEDTPLIIFASEKVMTRHGTVDLNQPISVYEYSITLGWTLKQDIVAVAIIQLEAFLIDSKLVYARNQVPYPLKEL